MDDITSAWKFCLSETYGPENNSMVVKGQLQKLHRSGHSRAFCLWIIRSQERVVVEKVVPLLKLMCTGNQTDNHVLHTLSEAHRYFVNGRNTVAELEKIKECVGCTRKFILRSMAMLIELVPSHLGDSVARILERLLSEYSQTLTGRERARRVCNQLVDLGFSEVLEDAIGSVAFDTMDSLVQQRTRNNYEGRALPGLVQWMQNFLQDWMALILPSATNDYDNTHSTDATTKQKDKDGLHLQHWRKRLFFRLHESVGNIRKGQLMILIQTFPKSLPALEDLKDCIMSTDQKPEVTSAMREQFTQTMLNAGTITSEILQRYVSVIKMLRFLDPSGVMLENVSGPVREYLRRRTDTVRCIVSGMTGDGELYEELQRGRRKRARDAEGDVHMSGGKSLESKIYDEEDEDCQSIDGYYNTSMRIDVEDYDNWEPEPIDAPRKGGKWKPGKDAIATLVTIYGTSEQIVNEYKGLLADKLINSFGLDLDREYKTLELLTDRFGKEAMHECLIMLNDIKDSKLVLETAQSQNPASPLQNFEAVVLSKEFWPKLQEESEFKATTQLETQMSLYTSSFQKHKHPRKLRWQHGVGTVAVHLEFEDGREVDVSVTPIQATILSHFAVKKKQTLQELQNHLGIKDDAVFRRKIQGLANLGVIRAADSNNSTYETVEHAGEIESASGGIDEENVPANDRDVGDEQPEDAQMAVYETYVMAMLQNLKQLPLEQIHNMLQRFVQTPAYDRTEAQLAAFLSQLIEEEKIELSAGMYKVKKR
ncbi:Anaphase-promoting complex subunit 2 [Gracilariopsis chorda]|uniref:Anaphase-promoting complex subunit 2 n=1 Tax=Gracilariopsis chorda TaxID=448386 RepID=A0A2V3J289_9FLOR|nr:Anaphase-promoting complex subunit 2 [Gracilariopsis chorda]|eukprot:PXF48212.1 Anaphase-promoting complex subunit 2 [Gracilariopsis chorda]